MTPLSQCTNTQSFIFTELAVSLTVLFFDSTVLTTPLSHDSAVFFRNWIVNISAFSSLFVKKLVFRIARADWSQGRRYQAPGIWDSGKQGRAGQWVKGGANRVSL
jgi:hypothetical protein